jgi:hypothetical protein
MTVYQNTGGNFDAPPITTAQAVGTAIVSFSSCESGQLSYSLLNGRSGTIPIIRIMPSITCSTPSTPKPTNQDFSFSGNWYDPNASGQGLIIETNPRSSHIFITWYTYAVNGATMGVAGQRWYSAEGDFPAGSRDAPVTLYETKGGIFDTDTQPTQSTVPVGSAWISFNTCRLATFNYSFTGGANAGQSGTLSLARLPGPEPGCTDN